MKGGPNMFYRLAHGAMIRLDSIEWMEPIGEDVSPSGHAIGAVATYWIRTSGGHQCQINASDAGAIMELVGLV